MIIITISALFLITLSLKIDPVNETCIQSSTFTVQYSVSQKINMHFFSLQPFSQSIFELDLRHFQQIPKTQLSEPCFAFKAVVYLGKDQQNGSPIYETMSNIMNRQNQFIFYTDKSIKLGLFFQIEQGYEAYKYMLLNSVSFKTILQNYRIPTERSSFLFVINSLDNINLPANRPNVQNYVGYYLNKIPYTMQSVNQSSSISSNSYWTTFNRIAVPFIPYISNCNGESNQMYLSQILQNQTDCKLVSISETVPIDQFKFGSSPLADICNVKRECIYDEKPGISMEFPYWLNLPEGSTLFSITKNKIEHQSYKINPSFDENELVPCKINESKGDNSSTMYPLNVKITLQYYQYNKQIKTMIACTISFSLYMESSSNFPYQFELETKPLNHTYIMLKFGFEWYVYMIVFVIIGFISNVQNLVLWLFHSCVSRKQKKQFRLRIYLRVIAQIVKGTFLALIFSIILVFSIAIIMNGKIFTKTLYSSDLDSSVPRVFWDYLNNKYINDYQSNLAIKYRSGRMGLSFLVVGSAILFYTSRFFIGCEKRTKQYNDYQVMGRVLKPRQWNKGKFIFGTYVYICIQFFFIYFAYSTVYSQNIWTFIVLIKIIQIIMQQITLNIYEDLLPCLPLKVITQITAYMNTLSADNLYDFLFSFLIDVAITMIQKAYIPQLQNIIFDKIHEKITEIGKFYAHLINDSDGQINEAVSKQKQEQEEENQFVIMNSQTEEVKFFEDQQTQTYNQDDQIQLNAQQVKNLQKILDHKLLVMRRYQSKQNSQNHVNNDQPEEQQIIQKNEQQIMEQTSLLFEILLDNILLLFTFLLQPFVILVYWITYDESGVLNNYGISNGVVTLYLLSAIVVAVFTIMNMIMIFHLLQSYLQVDFDQKIAKLLDRFFSRKLFWKAHDEDINKQIQISFRGADHYCLSWQFFFILATYVSSMILVMLGINTMINAQYNPFKDTAVSLVVLFWFTFIMSGIWLMQKLGYKFNIDGWRDFDLGCHQNSKNCNAIVDKDAAEMIRKSNNQQITNHPLVFSQSSQHQLIGSKMFLRRRKSQEFSSQNAKKLLSNNLQYKNNDEDSIISQDQQQNLNIKVNTICKKLQQKFQNYKFNLHYFQKNKSYLKQNIQKILPLMQQLPQLTQYKIPSSSQVQQVSTNAKKQNKNYDPAVLEMMAKWKLKTDQFTQFRQRNGKEFQKNLTSCSFCFSSWGIYYGFGGMCLKCSSQFHNLKKKK